MKRCLMGVFALIILGALSCSKDDGVDTDTVREPDINVMLIGEDSERVYQYNYNAANDTEIQTDLTQELGLDSSYLTLRQNGDLLSFYTFASGNFSLIQKNVATGASTIEANFYAENSKQSILWGTNDEQNIYLGFFSPERTSNFGVLTIDISSGFQSELLIEEDIQNSYQPIYHQGKLILTYRDNLDNYKVAVVETATNSILTTLKFETQIPNIFIDDMGDVAILKSDSGENYSYTIYDASSFAPIDEGDFSLRRFFNPGILTARLIEEKLFYYGLYVQPAEVLFRPSVFDLNMDVETLFDMEGIVRRVEEASNKSIQLVSQGIDQKSRSYLVGYSNLGNADIFDGGMLVVSFDGELIRDIELPFVPTYFLIRE